MDVNESVSEMRKILEDQMVVMKAAAHDVACMEDEKLSDLQFIIQQASQSVASCSKMRESLSVKLSAVTGAHSTSSSDKLHN